MTQFSTFNPQEVIFTAGTVPIDSGRGEDEFVAIVKTDDDVTYKASVDGDGTASVKKSTYHEVTLTMMSTSSGNAVLTGIHKAGKISSKGLIIVPIAVIDRGSNGDIFAAAEAWVKKFPDQTYSSEVGTVQWVFGVHNPERALMGH